MVSVIGVAELMYNAGIVRGNTALGLEPSNSSSSNLLYINFHNGKNIRICREEDEGK